jgi:CRP/FNR family transcriptional regulator, cyclic AMP receptor protein
MQTIDELLRDSPAFTGLEPSQLEVIAGCATNVHFEPDTILFREGDPADTFYLVRSGNVALEMFLPARGSLLIETIDEGEVIGWSWLFAPYRWHFDARTLTAVRATGFDGGCLRGKCDADPTLGYALMSRFAHLLIDRLQATRFRLLDVYGDVGAA